MISEPVYVTADGLAKIKAELADRIDNKRPLIAEKLSAAIKMGDLKENADYHVAKEEQAFEFNNINPDNYLIRVIQDSNGNGKWDTGNFLMNMQPEKVKYYPDEIEIRANWEKIETFILQE